MSTEETLRKALADLGAVALAILSSEHGSNVLGPEVAWVLATAEAKARAALALPVEARMEYRVVWTWDGHPCEESVDSHAEGTSLQASMSARGRYKDVIIESRTAAGEWKVTS